VFAGVNNAAGYNAIFDDFAVVVDVVEEEIQRGDPLSQPALDLFPFRRGDNPGQQVVRKNPLRAVTRQGRGSRANCEEDDTVFGDAHGN
jgi:hypothetical protein